MSTLFQVWRRWGRARLMQKTQQRQVRQAKTRRFQELCTEVEKAAALHDAHAMFVVINKFTPKQQQARARIRTPEGQMADQYTAIHSTCHDSGICPRNLAGT